MLFILKAEFFFFFLAFLSNYCVFCPLRNCLTHLTLALALLERQVGEVFLAVFVGHTIFLSVT